MEPVVVLGSAAIVCSFAVLWWAISGGRDQPSDMSAPTSERLVDMRSILLSQSATDRSVKPMVERIGARIGRIGPAGRLGAIDLKLRRAGSPGGWTVERVLAMKVLGALVLGGLMGLRIVRAPSLANVLIAIGAGVAGYFIPNGVLDHRAESRRTAVRKDLADTIDQLAVIVRAGLGIDAAIARIARSGEGPLFDEFTRVVQDMRVGLGRTAALTNMAERIDVPELRAFVAALAQAEQLGVPVGETLQIQAGEMRLRRRQAAEEQAMKLPVKILFPMVVCILPVLFIVLLGPAAIRIFDQLG